MPRAMGKEPQPVVIWGASGHALVVADIVRLMGGYEITGYLDDVSPHRAGEPYGGATVCGGRGALEQLRHDGVEHVALGVGNCRARLALAREARELGFQLVTAIHPSAIVAASASIGEGSVLCAGSVVNPGAKLGVAVIVNTSASVDHECILGDAAHICPGAHLAGRVNVGECTAVGIGSAVRDNIAIGADSVIGAGAAVLADLPANVTAYGVPARIIGSNE